MKVLVNTSVLLILFLSKTLALDAENYIAQIDRLSNDPKFVEEYTKWSSKLLSQPNYLYGDSHVTSPCPTDNSTDQTSIPESVHQLQPRDIKCIGALGDSFISGLGAYAITPVDLLFEDRGLSWSIGGDYTYSQIPTLPNAFRQYNPALKGFSTKRYTMSMNKQDNGLNSAKSGSRMDDLPDQARTLIERLKNGSLCNWENDWKLITIFGGINDLCTFCKDDTVDTNSPPEQYQMYVQEALDILYNASVPRMIVNVVLPPDIRGIKDLRNTNYVCNSLLKRICPCAAFPTEDQTKLLEDYTPQYEDVIRKLVRSRRYEKRDDFTVVIQPFMTKTPWPYRNNNNTIDFSYLAPDCFHFSGKGHAQAARSLWNNLFEPVGEKRNSWITNETLKCPTQKFPYIFTSNNSGAALEEIQLPDTVKPTKNAPTAIIRNATSVTSTFDSSSTRYSTNGSLILQANDPTAKSTSRPSMSNTKLFTIGGFFFLLMLLIGLSIRKRRQIHKCIPTTEDPRHERLEENSDSSDVEVYTKPNRDVNSYDNNQMTTTHGTRMSFE